MTDEDYEDGLETLTSFAEGLDCDGVIGFVEDERFVARLERVGGVKIANLVRL